MMVKQRWAVGRKVLTTDSTMPPIPATTSSSPRPPHLTSWLPPVPIHGSKPSVRVALHGPGRPLPHKHTAALPAVLRALPPRGALQHAHARPAGTSATARCAAEEACSPPAAAAVAAAAAAQGVGVSVVDVDARGRDHGIAADGDSELEAELLLYRELAQPACATGAGDGAARLADPARREGI
ncbi:hypothetical protein PYCCODRAFT_237344 [Trametes coccinea BRFM310]|uniref:Uncharacterized protein n=1 Tax=Trametes coccinea (strain BRFM310) TaxID=1353009 RepID=A0A1Y2IR45_TRAC3|nr:hypothetical protein PYCCODRAFT_237344 [Trametes coccinea BRFM310]